MGKKLTANLAIAALAFACAANYCLFVFPGRFAPAGVDGICTMIGDVFSINMGYFALLANVPLVICAFLFLNRDFAVKSTVFVVVFSVSVIFVKQIDLSAYYLPAGIFPPIAGGVVRGMLYFATIKLNGSAGGIDIISALIKRKRPHLNLMSIIFFVNMLIACCSFFVYGMKLEPVICSIIYAFITSSVCDRLRAMGSETVKFEIITRQPEALCQAITGQLHQKATVLDAHGAYSGDHTKMVLCVVKKKDAPYVEALILKTGDCITFKSAVSDSIAGVTYL